MLLVGSAAGDVVELRDGKPALHGEVSRLDDAGVRIATESAGEVFVPWDRVRQLKTVRPEPELPEMLKRSEMIWRARSRLERNDAQLAEPLFERLFTHFRGQTHETALVVAEGLLRCRLQRSANETAVIAALETARIRRAGVTTTSYASLDSVIDGQTSLCPALAPAWAPSLGPALVKLERDLGAYESLSDAVIASIAQLYRQAVRQQLGMAALETKQAAPNHPGTQLMLLVVSMSASDGSARATARERMRRELPKLPLWAQAWGQYGVGMSLIREGDSQAAESSSPTSSSTGMSAQYRAGLVALVHLPARYASVNPYLAGLALAQLAQSMEAQGQAEAAAALRQELERNYPALSKEKA